MSMTDLIMSSSGQRHIPRDAGTFIAMDGILYAPDLTNHGTTSTDRLGDALPSPRSAKHR